MSRSSLPRRAWACGSALALVLMALAAGPAQAHHPRRSPGLRDLAPRPLIGTAVNTDLLGSDATYTRILDREFNSVTPENAMKWESVERERGVLDFSAADRLVAHARAKRQVVRGHTLVWHSQLPAWLTSGTFTDAELEAILHQHITDEVSHFRGRVTRGTSSTRRSTRTARCATRSGCASSAPATSPRRSAGPTRPIRTPSSTTTTTTSSRSGPRATRPTPSSRTSAVRACRIDGVGFQGHLGLQYPYPDTLGANLAALRRARRRRRHHRGRRAHARCR